MNYLCFKCDNVAEAEIWKLPKKFLKEVEELKAEVENHFGMFKVKRDKLTWRNSLIDFFKPFLTEHYWLKRRDFDMWLFDCYKDIWDKRQDYKYNKDYTHYIKCSICDDIKKIKGENNGKETP